MYLDKTQRRSSHLVYVEVIGDRQPFESLSEMKSITDRQTEIALQTDRQILLLNEDIPLTWYTLRR
jgi:hypothetical protein